MSEMYTNLHDGIIGDLSGVRGDLSGVWGDLNGVRGDLSGVRGKYVNGVLITYKK